MSAGTYTPGPWTNNLSADWPYRQSVYVSAANWGVVATVNIDPSLAIHPQQLANLHLMTAAPVMFDALQTAIGVMKLQRDVIERGANAKAWDGPIAYLEAALSAATGLPQP